MKNYIGIGAALVVIGLAFFMGPSGMRAPEGDSQGLNLPPLSFSPSNIRFDLNLPETSEPSVAREAFAVFNQYREFARTGNIEGVKSLSHQLSPACSDPARAQECENLMASVYYFTQDFKEEDFKHVYFDNRQLVMFTEFSLPKEAPPEAGPISATLFFIRTNDGPKLLAIQFCAKNTDKEGHCLETNPTKRDADNNGWWDQIESFFR